MLQVNISGNYDVGWLVTIHDDETYRFRTYYYGKYEAFDMDRDDARNSSIHKFETETQFSRDSNELNLIAAFSRLHQQIGELFEVVSIPKAVPEKIVKAKIPKIVIDC